MTARKIQSDLAGLAVKEQSSFSTAATGTYTRLRDVRNVKFTPGLNVQDPEYSKSSDMRGPDASVIGGKGGTLTFDMPLHTIDGSECPAMSLMKRCGCTLVSVTSTNITGQDSTSSFTVASSALGNIAVGCGLLHSPASGTVSLRWCTSVTTTSNICTIEANQNFDTEPEIGDTLQPCDTITPTGGEPGAYFSFYAYEGAGSTDILRWSLVGCAGKASLQSTDADSLPIVSFEFMVDAWTDDEAAVAQTDVSGNTVAPLLGDSMLIDGTATETRNVSFDPGLAPVAVPATSGDNGRSAWFYATAQPALGFLPLHDTAWITKLEAGTTFDWCFSSVQSESDAWGVWVPKVQVVGYETVDSDGLKRAQMTTKVCDPGSNSDSTLYPMWAFSTSK